MATLNREVLAERLSERAEITMAAARDEVRWFFDQLGGAVLAGEEVRIHGFASFRPVQRAATVRRNPRTGEPVNVAAHRAVRFVPSTTITNALRAPVKKAAPKRGVKK